MKQALSISNVLNAKFRTINVSDEWRRVVGIPELTGTWMIYGAPKNGKTTFAMQLAKYLCGFGRVAYDSVEEGLSLTIQSTMERVRMDEVNGQCMLLDREPVADLIKRINVRSQPCPSQAVTERLTLLFPAWQIHVYRR